MKKFIRIILAVMLVFSAGVFEAQANICPGGETTLTPIPSTYQQITVSTAAVTLTVPRTARVAIIMVEDNPLRYLDDGGTPTASSGTLVQNNVGLAVCGAALPRFKAIRSGASDAKISVNYYE